MDYYPLTMVSIQNVSRIGFIYESDVFYLFYGVVGFSIDYPFYRIVVCY